MKTTFLVLCLFLSVCRAAVVLDTDGNPVRNAGGTYYLMPVSAEVSGGLRLASVGNDPDPKTVVLDPLFTPGFPVRFESPLRIPFIFTSFPLNIRLLLPSFEPGIWSVVQEFPFWTVKISETESVVGPFKLETANGGYKIVYYPKPDEAGEDIGLVHIDGLFRLVIKNGDPFIFTIVRGHESSAKVSIV